MFKTIRVLVALLGAALISHASATQAAVIAGWDFSGLTDGGPNNLSASTEDPAVAVQGLARNGPGPNDPQANAGVGTFGSNALVAQNQADAITFGSYLSFSITTLEPGVSLTDIAAYNTWVHDQDPSTLPPSDFFGVWQYRTDANAFADIGSSFQLITSGGTGQQTKTQSALALSGFSDLQSMDSGTQADFRFVIWGAGYGANYAGFNSFQAGDDLIINGTVPVPEPSTAMLALVAVAAGIASARLRRSVK